MRDQEAAGPPKKRKRRFLRGLVTVLVGTVVLASAYLWSERLNLASMQVSHVLETAGVKAFEFEITRVGFWGAQVQSIRIGDVAQPDLLIEDLKLTYSLAGLLAGRVDGIEIGSLRLRAGVGPEGLVLGHLDPLFASKGPSATGSFSISDVLVDDLQVTVSFPEGVIDVGGGVHLLQSEAGLRVQPSDGCLRVGLHSLQLGAGVLDDVSGDVCLADPDNGLSWPTETGLALTVSDFPLVLRGDDLDVLLEANLAGFSVDLGNPGGSNPSALTVRVAGSRLVLPGFDLALSDIDLVVALEDIGALSGPWSLTRARVEDMTPATRFAPMRLVGEGQLAPERVTFDLIVSDPTSFAPLLSIGGAHTLAEGRGTAFVEVGPLIFQSDDLQPQNLVPSLKGLMTNVAGGLRGEGHFRWRQGHLTSDGVLELDDIALTTGTARIEGVSGALTFDHLLPPVTAPGQLLSVGLVDAGFRLTEGSIAFAIKREGAVQVERAQWPFAGGVISLSSGLIEPGALEQELVLDIVDVDLASLIALLNLDGLSGSGTVTGRVPIVIRDGDPIVVGASLVAGGGGQLSYKGAGTGALEGGQGALLFEALEDFRYTSLTLSLDGNAQGLLTLKLSIEGANPQLYDGYPFAINVNTEASFAELLRSATLSTRALDLIREQSAVGQSDETEKLENE